MDEVKPCPFCGQPLVTVPGVKGETWTQWFCRNPACAPSEAEIEAYWATRTVAIPKDDPDAEVS